MMSLMENLNMNMATKSDLDTLRGQAATKVDFQEFKTELKKEEKDHVAGHHQ